MSSDTTGTLVPVSAGWLREQLAFVEESCATTGVQALVAAACDSFRALTADGTDPIAAALADLALRPSARRLAQSEAIGQIGTYEVDGDLVFWRASRIWTGVHRHVTLVGDASGYLGIELTQADQQATNARARLKVVELLRAAGFNDRPVAGDYDQFCKVNGYARTAEDAEANAAWREEKSRARRNAQLLRHYTVTVSSYLRHFGVWYECPEMPAGEAHLGYERDTLRYSERYGRGTHEAGKPARRLPGSSGPSAALLTPKTMPSSAFIQDRMAELDRLFPDE